MANSIRGNMTLVAVNGELGDLTVPGTLTAADLAVTDDLTITDDLTVTGDIIGNTILERTAAAGVTIDSVLCKDGGIRLADGAAVAADIISEKTAAAGVTIDSVLVKDGGVTLANATALLTDIISEKVAAAGVTIDGVLLKDGGVTLANATALLTDIISEKVAAAGVTIDGCLIKDGRAANLAVAAMFLSTEITGNGAEQDTAHGFGTTPSLVYAVFSDLTGGAAVIAYGTHDATNCKFTVTTGEKYRVVAFK